MGRSCEAFTSDLAIKTIALPPYRYPDVSVICGEAQFEKMEGIAVLANPTLIIEVLSSKTEKRDRNEKRLAMPGHSFGDGIPADRAGLSAHHTLCSSLR